MDKRKRLVFATNNAHKLEEARRIMPTGLEIVSLAEIGCHDDIPETADTLEGNALIKARWVHDRYGYDCFVDDTGLMVDALGGAPGVRSARYAGEECDSKANMKKLLTEMEGERQRDAHFSTVIALVADGEEHCFEGRVDGAIASAPHGEGGFGYDPVFVAKESGKCFAEMLPDEKNAISHRGRAMRKLSQFLGLLSMLLVMMICGFTAKAEQWRLHGSYDGNMERIIDTQKYTYFLGLSQDYDPTQAAMSKHYGILMRYDKEGEEMMVLNTQNLLSSNTVMAIEYNFAKKFLVVAFDDGNVDLIYDNGDTYTVPGLKLSQSAPSKTIKSITVDNPSGTLYITTDFGYYTISDSNKEVSTSRVYNVPVNALSIFDGKMWLASGNTIYCGAPGEYQFSNFEKVAEFPFDPEKPGTADVVRMYPMGNRGIVILYGAPSNRSVALLYKDDKDGDHYATRPLVGGNSRGVEPLPNGVLLCHPNSISILHADGKDAFFNVPVDDRNALFGTYNESDFWMSAQRKGISLKRKPASGDKWTVLKDRFFPNVSSSFLSAYMAYSPEYGMLVRNHSMDHIFYGDKGNYFYIPDMLSGYKDMNWSRLSATYRSDSKGLALNNPRGIAIDPKNPDHVYCGSVNNGFMRLDMKNVENSIHISKRTDVSGGYGHPGFVVAVEESPENASWAQRCVFSAPAFDAYGILWISHLVPNNRKESDSEDTELWYWMPEERASVTSATNFKPLRKLTVKGAKISNSPLILPLKTSANRNLILLQGNTKGGGLTIYDHNGTPADTSDDRMVTMTELYDQDGQKVEFLYGFAHYEDPLTGLVWLSTGNDLITFKPSEAFDNPSAVRRIKVARNDGTNLADYLLNKVQVNGIIADKSGNKWFATMGAGVMCTSSDGREVLNSYTTDNSPLPDNDVYSIGYNPDTNSIMASTDKGLAELFLSGTSAGGGDEAKVYPNPVASDFFGYVTIEGLQDDAMIKIVDVAGNLVKECGVATGGRAQWDVTNMNRKRVPGGVYFVIATNAPNSDNFVQVGKVLVVN